MNVAAWLLLVWAIDQVLLALSVLVAVAWVLGCGLAVMAEWFEEAQVADEDAREEWR